MGRDLNEDVDCRGVSWSMLCGHWSKDRCGVWKGGVYGMRIISISKSGEKNRAGFDEFVE